MPIYDALLSQPPQLTEAETRKQNVLELAKGIGRVWGEARKLVKDCPDEQRKPAILNNQPDGTTVEARLVGKAHISSDEGGVVAELSAVNNGQVYGDKLLYLSWL